MTVVAKDLNMNVLTVGLSRKPSTPLLRDVGAHPDDVKMASTIRALRSWFGQINMRLVAAGQHRQLQIPQPPVGDGGKRGRTPKRRDVNPAAGIHRYCMSGHNSSESGC